MRRLCSALALAALLVVAPAGADTDELSEYERDVLAEALAAVGGTVDPSPEGKTVEGIELYRLKVFDRRDPVPNFVNVLHAQSREHVLRRELLFGPGQPYSSELAAESARNLRDITQLSLVLVIPITGSTPDRVRVLLITKDIWSLRAAWDPEIGAGGITRMGIAADEINVAGRHKTISLRGGFDPGSYWYGARYFDPRVAGSRLFALGGASLVFDRDTGDPEGSFGTLWYGQPLYSLDSRWGFDTYFAWRVDRAESFVGVSPREFDARSTPGDDAIPYAWDRGVYYAGYLAVRSFGRDSKLDLAFGADAVRGEFGLPPGLPGSPAALAEFRRREVPPDHQRVSPIVEVRAHSSRFLRTLDVDTLALQEDLQLGHDLTLRFYPASRELGSSRDLFGVALAASYSVPVGDGLARGIVTTTNEVSEPTRSDALVGARLQLVSPRLGFGRLVYDARLDHRYHDYLKERFTAGVSTRLRGYLPDRFRGKDLLASNLELRTTSVGLLGVELGGAAFYDVADAFDGFDDLHPREALGFGLRILFPMFDRVVFRGDVGFPLDRERDDGDPGFSYLLTFGQNTHVLPQSVTTVPAALAVQ